jgi:NAD(P)-dependent dehydrogenase (short-subunit alcohol dehydrogenase family)
MGFEDAVVAVTGAAGGIGRPLCQYFAARGALVAAFDRSDAVLPLAASLGHAGRDAAGFVVDIADAAAVSAAFEQAAAQLGTIDVLINNAGATDHPVLERTDAAGLGREIAVNLNGAWHCASAVLPSMKTRRRGAIVNIGSVNGLMALGDAGYSAGKAGLISLTRAMALEFGRYNIRANIVCPGTVRTPIWTERAARHPEILTTLARWYPLGRIVEPAEVVAAVAFLASDAASAITGAVLTVDCGLSAGNLVMARELTLEAF